jgi:hypothetical protein
MPMMSIASATTVEPPNLALPLSDGTAERAVLCCLLDCHPRNLTLAQLTRELGGRPEPKLLHRAVANLTAASLIVSRGDRLAAAPFAVSFDRALQPA